VNAIYNVDLTWKSVFSDSYEKARAAPDAIGWMRASVEEMTNLGSRFVSTGYYQIKGCSSCSTRYS
jgi:hypothetical protein